MKKETKIVGNYEGASREKKIETLLLFFVSDVKSNTEELLKKEDLDPFVKEILEKTYSCAYFVFEESKKVLDVEFETKIV